jgi:hypothetical protein
LKIERQNSLGRERDFPPTGWFLEITEIERQNSLDGKQL